MKKINNITSITIMVLSILILGISYLYLHNNDIHPLRVEEKVEEIQAQKPVVDQKQLQCMADNIYFEAGAEPNEGKAAVARVVLNRISHGGFGSTPCKVVYQSHTVKQTNEDDESFWVKVCQFSWVCEGKKNPNRNSIRYQTSLQVAYDVLAYDMYREIIPKTVLFFHNTSVVNHYPHEVVARIGNHIFYKKKNVNKRFNRYSKKSGPTLVLNGELPAKANSESI